MVRVHSPEYKLGGDNVVKGVLREQWVRMVGMLIMAGSIQFRRATRPTDENRILQIFGGLSTPGHPMAKFMWCYLASLSPEGMSDTELHSKLH